jgi:hypothetical protein
LRATEHKVLLLLVQPAGAQYKVLLEQLEHKETTTRIIWCNWC